MTDIQIIGNRCVRFNDGAQADASGIAIIGSLANPYINVRVVGNFYSGPTGAFAATIATGIVVRGALVSIVGNNLSGGLMGISLDGGQSQSTFMACSSNTITAAKNYGIEIGGVGYCTVSGNTINGGSTTAYGIIIDTADANNYNAITGNVIQSVTTEGISHAPSGSASASVTAVSGNVIQGAPLGIRVQQSTSWSITGNLYVGNSSSAFVLAVSNASGTIGSLSVVGNVVSSATAVLEHNASTALTANNMVVQGNIYTGGAHLKKSGSAVIGASVSATRGAAGNIAAPSVPATTVATQNSALSDATIYITAGSSTCTVAIEGTTAYVVPSSGVASFRLLAGQSVTLTYTNAPTWKWFLD
jgi:hypothetical protein